MKKDRKFESQAAASGRSRLRLQAWVSAVLALTLAFGAWTGALAADGETAADAGTAPVAVQVDEALGALQASAVKAGTLSDWTAFALARGGVPVQERYLAQAKQTVTADSLRLATDYSRTALAINASGGDARHAGSAGIDLLARLANFDKLTAQGPNAPAFALMALDAGGYVSGAQDKWTRDSLIRWLVEQRAEGGGWSLVPGQSDVDVTGIVLTALAPYKDREEVRPAVEGALDWLSSVQLASGGFGSPETSESAVQTIIALTSLDIDPAGDARFVKNGHSVLARLLEFRLPDGSFRHVPGGQSDSLATLYALLGLTAADRWQDGLPGLYAGLGAVHSVQVKVYGPEGKLAQGIGSGRTVMEDLIQVLKRNRVPYQVTRDPQYGPYLTSVGSYASGAYGGYDGWQYAVKKDRQWASDLTGMSAYDPSGASEIVVYYGDSPALIHSVTLEPASPREGLPVTVVVEKETYDWNAGRAVVAPAEGANVTIGGVTAVTDKDGRAVLTGVKAGETALRVDGYRPGKLPAYVTYEQPITVAAYVKHVSVRVEGDQGPVAEGTAEGGTALEALERLLKADGIAYELKEMSFGKYVSSIDGITEGKYGGYDGWMFAVKDGSGWIHPGEGIDTFLLDDGQELVVYYGGDATKLAEAVAVVPSPAKPEGAVTVAVTYRDMDWATGKPGPAKPLAGARVTAAGVTAVTDASGQAKLSGLPEGDHRITVTGYGKDEAPLVVRASGRVFVAGDYADQAQIPAWAADWVREARASGVLLGLGDKKDAPFSPKTAVTRAEFVSSLVRALGGLPAASGSSFKDVPADAWYAKDVEAAAEAGLVAGMSPGVFAPDAKLTREQAAMLLARALKIQTATAQPIADQDQVSAAALAAVQAVVEQGWMTTQPDGKFLPKMTMPREQAAVIAVRVLLRGDRGSAGM